MKEWKGFALSVCIGLIMGGGLSAAIASAKIAAVEVELKNEIKEVEAEVREVELDGYETLKAVGALSVAIARIEAHMEAANDKLDALAR